MQMEYWSVSGCDNYEYWFTFMGNKLKKTHQKQKIVWVFGMFLW